MSTKIRRVLKKKKPLFARNESTKRKRLSRTSYRRPKGYGATSEKRRGRRKTPSVGYSSPRNSRGLHSSGLREIIITNVNELEKVSENQAIRISSGVGLKNREKIAKTAISKKIRVLNFEPGAFLKSLEDSLKARKERRGNLLKEREAKQKKKEAKKEEPKKEKKKDIKELEVMQGSKKKAKSQEKPRLDESKGIHKEKNRGPTGV